MEKEPLLPFREDCPMAATSQMQCDKLPHSPGVVEPPSVRHDFPTIVDCTSLKLFFPESYLGCCKNQIGATGVTWEFTDIRALNKQ
ncbi:hypothetical protein STEG23_032745, partial [Scotinomys teguina]